MKKRYIFLSIATVFTIILFFKILNFSQVSVFASDFMDMVDILNAESSINPTFENGMFFAKYIFRLFLMINIMLILSLFIYLKNLKIKEMSHRLTLLVIFIIKGI